MRNKVMSLLLAVTLLLVAVSPVFAEGPSGDFEVIRAAAEKYLTTLKSPVITADALFTLLNDGDASNDPFILSVRKPEDYALGHIPGAVNIFYKDIAKPENLAKLPKDKQIVVYCYTGHTGQLAATILGLLGYDAGNIKYGMMGWTKDDKVLAQPRYDVNTAPDYPVEGSAAPTTMPVTGAETNLTWLVLVAGIVALFTGSVLYARRAAR